MLSPPQTENTLWTSIFQWSTKENTFIKESLVLLVLFLEANEVRFSVLSGAYDKNFWHQVIYKEDPLKLVNSLISIIEQITLASDSSVHEFTFEINNYR